jgi:hypothetical protein
VGVSHYGTANRYRINHNTATFIVSRIAAFRVSLRLVPPCALSQTTQNHAALQQFMVYHSRGQDIFCAPAAKGRLCDDIMLVTI